MKRSELFSYNGDINLAFFIAENKIIEKGNYNFSEYTESELKGFLVRTSYKEIETAIKKELETRKAPV